MPEMPFLLVACCHAVQPCAVPLYLCVVSLHRASDPHQRWLPQQSCCCCPAGPSARPISSPVLAVSAKVIHPVRAPCLQISTCWPKPAGQQQTTRGPCILLNLKQVLVPAPAGQHQADGPGRLCAASVPPGRCGWGWEGHSGRVPRVLPERGSQQGQAGSEGATGAAS